MATTIVTRPAATYAIDDTTASDTITVVNGPVTSGYQTTEVTDANGANQFIFANQAAVTIDGGSKGDNVVFDNPNPAQGLLWLTVQNLGSSSGSITGSNPSASSPDVVAATLNLTAAGSIGSGGRALQTQTNTLNATVGILTPDSINITNGVSAPVTLNIGVSGFSADGTINLTNSGSIDDYAGRILGSGGITVHANGATADLNTGSGGGINSNVGAVNLTVGEDINLGDGVGTGSIAAGTGIIASAGRNVTLNANATITNGAAGLISITAGMAGGAGNITMLTAPGSAPGAPEIVNQASTGTITLTALHGGTLTLDSTGSTAVLSNNGNIILTADAVVINKEVNAVTARLTVANATAGQAIRLGSGNAPGALGLTPAELNLLAAAIVQVGSSSAGNITITSPIAGLAHTSTLTLENAGSITQTALGSLDVTNLALNSTGPVTLTNPNNVVSTVAANVTNAVAINDGAHTLGVGTVDGDVGIATSNAAISLTADSLGINQKVNAGTGIVTIAPFSASQAIALGDVNSAGTLGLNDAGLALITASVLRIDGNATNDFSNITVSGAVTRHTGYNTLSLASEGNFTQTVALAVANLALSFDSGITMTTAGNSVDTLAFANVNFSVAITDGTGSALTIGAVDGMTSSYNTGTTTAITTGGNLKFATGLYSAGAATLTSTGGMILDGANSAVEDVAAPTLALSASTGIGTSGDALQTQVGTLSASTSTGGIFIDNDSSSPGTLNIGIGSTGLKDSGASGDIVLLANGTINSLTSGAVITGPANITVKALGANADINLGGQASLFSVQGLQSGSIDIEAGRDLNLGNSAGYGAIKSGGGSVGSIILAAGRNLTIDPNAFVSVPGGTGGITATAGGNFTMTTTPGTLGDEFITQGGAIMLSAGAGESMTIASTGTDAVHSSGGNITLTADQMTITKGVNAGGGNVRLQPTTAGQFISLGTATGGLTLTNAELNEVTATTLTIGNATAGSVTVAGTVDPTHVTNLTIETAADFSVNSAGMSVAGSLTIDFGQNGIGGVADLSAGNFGTGVSLVGGAGNDTFLACPSALVTMTGGGGSDTFGGTGPDLDGDTITDLSDGDKIVFTDATLANFAFQLSGTKLNCDDNAVQSSLTLSNAPVGHFIETADLVAGVDLTFDATPGDDFNGDGTGDVLFQNERSGQLTFAEMAGGSNIGVGAATMGLGNFVYGGSGDVNGDGIADVVVQNPATGIVFVGYQDGKGDGQPSYVPVANVPGWRVEGVGDLTGDDDADLVIQNQTTGALNYYDVHNNHFGALTAPAGFTVVGVGYVAGGPDADVVVEDFATGIIGYLNIVGGAETGMVPVANTPGWDVRAVGDLNGDGDADIVIQNEISGQVTSINMAGGAFNGFDTVTSGLTADYAVKDAVDVNGDGVPDLIIQQQSTGATLAALQGASGFTGWATVSSTVGGDTLVAGDGAVALHQAALDSDYTGGGTGDVLLRNPGTGQLVFAEMSAGSFTGVVGNASGALPGLSYGGHGDINGDGIADVVVENSGGAIFVGLENGTGNGQPMWSQPAAVLGWSVVGVGDITGQQGLGNIVIQKQSGGAIDYYNVQTNAFTAVAPSIASQVVGIGDVNGDGYDDIVLQSASGSIDYLNMAGGVNNGLVHVANTPGFSVRAVGDIYGNGFADIVIQSPSTGQVEIANMQGGAFDGFDASIPANGLSSSYLVTDAVDVANNGHADIIIQNQSTGALLYAQEGNAGFNQFVAINAGLGSAYHAL